MELIKTCSLITKCITSISLMIIAISTFICCSKISEAKINDSTTFYIKASMCKGDVCEYNLKGSIVMDDDKIKFPEVNPDAH